MQASRAMQMENHLPPLHGAHRATINTGLPALAGAGFKPLHLDDWISDAQAPAFFEVHAENYLGAGGAPHAKLSRMRQYRPFSLHGVGLSIGAESGLDCNHLQRIAALIERYQPEVFSEHLAWSTHGEYFLNDLLPLTYDMRTLDRVCNHIDQVQARLGRPMLLENPSTYFEFTDSTLAEPDFIRQVVERSGCGLLLDINNVYVSCRNNQHDPLAYLDSLPLRAVGQVHLAGHAEQTDEDGNLLLIDNHGAPVADAVWALYAYVLSRTGPVATLIEWDTDVPAYARLRAETQAAGRLLDAARNSSTGIAA